MKRLLIGISLVATVTALVLWSVRGGGEPARESGGQPADLTSADAAEHNRAVALMGRFEYAAAVDAYAALTARFPDWLDLRIDHGIALLNRSRPDTKDLDKSLAIMLSILRTRPADLRARHCIGILLLYRGMTEEALPYFLAVAEADEEDGYAATFAGDCLYQLDRPEEALAWYRKAKERDPYLRSAWYGTFRILRALGRDAESKVALAVFHRLEDNPQARLAEIKYTRMGPHALVQRIEGRGPLPALPAGPLFEQRVALPVGVGSQLLTGGDVRLSAADIDGDGQGDLLLTGVKGCAVLLRRGEGFEHARQHPLRAATRVRCALWGDVDNDGRVDVYLCRQGPNQLWMQGEAGAWTEVAEKAGVGAGSADTRDGALLDIDHDGDLDLVLLHAAAPFEVLINRLDGTFMALPEDAGLRGSDQPARGLVACDLDRDRDLDLMVLHEGSPHEVFINDRLWRWHAGEGYAALCAVPAVAGVATDVDADGRPEINLLSNKGLARWARNEAGTWALDGVAKGGGSALGVLDADGDGRLELLVTDDQGWRLLDAADFHVRFKPDGGAEACTSYVWSAAAGEAIVGFAPGGEAVVWRPGAGRHPFAALTFSGRHHDSDQMRSNAAGRGVQVSVRAGTQWTVRSTYRPFSGPGQSQQPLLVGGVGGTRIDFATLLWTDGLLQTETDLATGTLHRIEETQRQTSSCPVLFAWDGERFAFVTDVLGVGGVGFWVAPDTYAPPAPQETVMLPPGLLQPRDGELVLKLTEPMEETCYLDGARLEAVDVPPGWQVNVDDRMAVLGPAPTGALVFHREPLRPAHAVDQAGRDVRAAVARIDHKAAPVAELDHRFIGRTKEQILTLSFATPLDGPEGVPVLLADGWIEYPYAQTLFAAWQADAVFEAPTIEALGAEGVWKTLLPQYGYPAGMPRRSSVPLRGLPAGTRTLRIRTTQEVYWDRLAVAHALPCPEAARENLALRGATLASTGFALRTTTAQRLPHYDDGSRAPLWDARHQAGWHTRFGHVDELLAATDDAVTIFGPGEGVELRYTAPAAVLPKGWTRHYVLRVTGWCKDMDLFTLNGETVGPLPVRAASGKADPARARLHPSYQTRYKVGR